MYFRTVVIFVVCFSARGAHGEQIGEPVDSLMMSFTRSMRGIEKGLHIRSADVAAEHAEALSRAALGVDVSRFHVDAGMDRSTFLSHVESIDEIARRIARLTGDGNLQHAQGEMVNLRRTCVSCHVLFGGDSFGSYPAEGNIVSGAVEILKLDGGRRLDRSNAVVFIDRVANAPLAQSKPVRRTFSQRNRAFMPRVMPVVKGTEVKFPNDDTIFHNVFSLFQTLPFDLDIYPPGESKKLVFSSTGWVKVYCNIHPNMIGHILVLDNTFFSLTDEWGRFVISGIPDGTYDLRVWHEFGPDAVREVVLRSRRYSSRRFRSPKIASSFNTKANSAGPIAGATVVHELLPKWRLRKLGRRR